MELTDVSAFYFFLRIFVDCLGISEIPSHVKENHFPNASTTLPLSTSAEPLERPHCNIPSLLPFLQEQRATDATAVAWSQSCVPAKAKN